MKLHVGLQNLGLCSAVMAFEQEMNFYRATLAMLLSSKAILRLHVVVFLQQVPILNQIPASL